MTQDSSRKTAIRARMAETGEVYSVAARKLDSQVNTPLSDKKADFGELVLLTERLAVILDTSVTLARALQAVGPYTEDAVLKEAIDFVLSERQDGVSFEDAVALRPNAFRGIFLEVVRANAATPIADIMRSLAKLYRVEFEMELNRNYGRPLLT
jgi:type II secretory pathway component PulF